MPKSTLTLNLRPKIGFPHLGGVERDGAHITGDGIRDNEEIEFPTFALEAGGLRVGVVADLGGKAVEPSRVS